jgi:hypothetical protein
VAKHYNYAEEIKIAADLRKYVPRGRAVLFHGTRGDPIVSGPLAEIPYTTSHFNNQCCQHEPSADVRKVDIVRADVGLGQRLTPERRRPRCLLPRAAFPASFLAARGSTAGP